MPIRPLAVRIRAVGCSRQAPVLIRTTPPGADSGSKRVAWEGPRRAIDAGPAVALPVACGHRCRVPASRLLSCGFLREGHWALCITRTWHRAAMRGGPGLHMLPRLRAWPSWRPPGSLGPPTLCIGHAAGAEHVPRPCGSSAVLSVPGALMPVVQVKDMSLLSPACLMISHSMPRFVSGWFRTVIQQVGGGSARISIMWMPFCCADLKHIFPSILTMLLPETAGILVFACIPTRC